MKRRRQKKRREEKRSSSSSRRRRRRRVKLVTDQSEHILAPAAVSALVLAVETIIPAAQAVTHLKLVFASVLPGGSWFEWDDFSGSEELQHTHEMSAMECVCVRACMRCDNMLPSTC